MLVLAVTVAFVTGCGGGRAERAVTSSRAPSPPPSAQENGEWTDIPPAPGSATGAPVWTGRDLLVWSGDDNGTSMARGGAVYDAATGAWHEFPEGPLVPRAWHSGVWTGTEVVYWGGVTSISAKASMADGAAFDPATGAWRRIARAPIPGRHGHLAFWIGHEMVVWGGTVQCCAVDSAVHDPSAAAYDPAANRWRRLPDVPAPWSGSGGPLVVAAWNGSMLVWRGDRLGRLDVAANTWHDLGSPPAASSTCQSTGRPVAKGSLAGDRFVVWTGSCGLETGAVYDLVMGTWARVAAQPGLTSALSTGSRLYGVFGAASLASYDVDGGRWSAPTTPRATIGATAFTAAGDGRIVLWGGYDRASIHLRNGAVYRPAG